MSWFQYNSMNSGLRKELHSHCDSHFNTFQYISYVSGMCQHVACFLPHLDLSPGHRRVHWILPKSEGKSNAKSVGCLRHFCAHSVTLCRSCVAACHTVSHLTCAKEVPNSKCSKRNCRSWHPIFLVLKHRTKISFVACSSPSAKCLRHVETCWINMLNHVLHTVPRLGRSLEGLEVPTVAVVCSNYYSNLETYGLHMMGQWEQGTYGLPRQSIWKHSLWVFVRALIMEIKQLLNVVDQTVWRSEKAHLQFFWNNDWLTSHAICRTWFLTKEIPN